MEILNDAADQVMKSPAWVLILGALTLLSLVWKKSHLPNRYLILANLAVSSGYCFLSWEAESYRRFYNPHTMVVFHAFVLFLVNEIFHEGIMTKLKARFPNVKWPDGPEVPPPEAPPSKPIPTPPG